MSTLARTVAAGTLAAAGIIGTVAAPHAAAEGGRETYDLCVAYLYINDVRECVRGGGYAIGQVDWNNRTATVTGHVVGGSSRGYTTAIFEAFDANDIKRDSTTRTASGRATRSYEFLIGPPDLRGGITRIKLTVCVYVDASRTCSNPPLQITE